MKKRIVSLLMAAVVVFTSIPQEALAAVIVGDILTEEDEITDGTEDPVDGSFDVSTGRFDNAALPKMEYIEGTPYAGITSKQTTVPENGTYILTIGRTGDLSLPSEVLLKTVDVSASYGRDYEVCDERFDTEVYETDGTVFSRGATDEAIEEAGETISRITDQILQSSGAEDHLVDQEPSSAEEMLITEEKLNEYANSADIISGDMIGEGSVEQDDIVQKEANTDAGTAINDTDTNTVPERSVMDIDEETASLATLKAAQSGRPVRETTDEVRFTPITESFLGEFSPDVSDYVDISSQTRVVFGAGETEQTVTLRILEDSESEGQEMFNFLLSPDDDHTAVIEARTSVGFIIEDDEPVLHSRVSFSDSDYTADTDKVTLTIEREEAEYSYISMGIRTVDNGSAKEGTDYARVDTHMSIQPFRNEITLDIPVRMSEEELTFGVELYDLKGPDEGEVMKATVHIPARADSLSIQSGEDGVVHTQSATYAQWVRIGDNTYSIEYNDKDNPYIGSIMVPDTKICVGQYIAVHYGDMFSRYEGGDSGTRNFKLRDDKDNLCLYLSYYSSWYRDKGFVAGKYVLPVPFGRYRAVLFDEETGSVYDSAKITNHVSFGNNSFDTRTKSMGNRHGREVTQGMGFYKTSGNDLLPLDGSSDDWNKESAVYVVVERAEVGLQEPDVYLYGIVLLYKQFEIRIDQPDELEYRSGELDEHGNARLIKKRPATVDSATDQTRFYGQDLQISQVPAPGNEAIFGELKGYNITPQGGKEFFYKTNSSTLTFDDDLVKLIEEHTVKYKKLGELPSFDPSKDYQYSTVLNIKPVYEHRKVKVSVFEPQGLPKGAKASYVDKQLDAVYKSGKSDYEHFHVGDRINLSVTSDTTGYAFDQYYRAQYVNPGDTAYDTRYSGTLPVISGECPGPLLVLSKCEMRSIFSSLPDHIPVVMDESAQKYFTVRDLLTVKELDTTELKGKVDYGVLAIKDEFDASGSKYTPVPGRVYTVELDETADNNGKYRPVITLSKGQKIKGFSADLIADTQPENNTVKISAEAVDQSKYRYYTIQGNAMYSAYALNTSSEAVNKSPAMGAVVTAGGISRESYDKEKATIKRIGTRYSSITDDNGSFEIKGLKAIPGDTISVKVDNNDIQQVEYITLADIKASSLKKKYSFDEFVYDKDKKADTTKTVTVDCMISNAGRIDMPIRTFYSPYVSNLAYSYRNRAVDSRYNAVPIYENDKLTLSFTVATNKSEIKKVTVTKIDRNGTKDEQEATIDNSRSTDLLKCYSVTYDGQNLSDKDHFYVKLTAIPERGAKEITYTSLDTGLVMYTPRETPQSQYFNYSGLNVQPKGDLPLVGDMASKLDTGKLTWNTVYADPTNKDTSNYAEIVTVSVGVTKPPEKTLVNNAKTLNKVKNGTDPDSGKNWEQRFNEANDVYELLDLSEQRALMRQYRNDHPGATDNEIRDHVRANKAQYRDQFKKQAKKNALAESGKAKFSVSVQVLLQFEYKYDPVKKEHYYSGGQYIINCTGEVQKTFYWLVAGVPLFVNVKGSGSVQLDGRYATLKEQLRAKDLGYETDLTEIIPTESPWIQVTFGLSLQPGVGICGVLSVRGILQFTFWARTATSKVASGSSGGTMGVFQGGFGVDLIVFSFEKTWDIGSWRTGVFDKQGKLGTQSAGESDGSNITMYLRNFDNGEEVPPPLKINSTLLPEAKKTLINGAPEYIRPQIINLDNGELMLLFLRNMEGEVNALGEARNKDNATALQYAIRKKDGTYDTDENGNIRSNTIETDNNADSTLSAVKSGDKVYIAWSDSKVEAGSAQEFELAKKSLTSTSIHMAVYDIAAGKMSDVITVVDDSFVNSHVFLTEEGDNIALYYFKKDLSKAGNIEELAGVQNNYNTWARKVYDPKTGEFVKLMPDRPDPYEELIAISHPGITDPLVLDLNAEDYEYTDITGTAKDYRILSYTIDRDGSFETATDKELWVQLENLTDARTYYPVCLDAGGHTIDDPELFEMKDDVYLAWLTDGSVYNTLSAHDVFKGLDMENGTETGALGENGTPDTTITRSIERIRGLSKEDISKYGWNSLPYKQVETVDNARELYTLLYKLSEGELRTTHKDFGETSENGERISNILTEHQIVPGADGNLYLFWTGQDGSDLKNDQGRELYGAALYLNDGEDGARGWSNAVKLTDYGEVIDELSVEVAGDENAVLVGNMYTQKAQEKGGVEYGPHKLVQIDFKPGNSLAVEDAYFEFSDPYPVEGQIVEASIPIVNNGLLPARRYKLTVNGSSETAEDVIWPGETIEVTRQFKVDSEESLTVSARINELDEIQELAVKDGDGNKASITTDSRAVFDFGEPVIYDVDSDIFGTYMDQDVDEALSSDESLHACLKDSVNDDDEDEKGRIGAILDWIISDDYKPSDLVICVPVTNIGNLKGNNLKAKATALLFDDEGMHEAGVIGEGTLVTVPVKKADENGEAVTETVYMVIPLTGFDAAAHMDEMGNMEVRLDFTLDGEEISDTAHAKRQFVTNVEMKLASGARKLNLAVDQDYDLSSAIIARPWDQVKELSFESEDETVAMVSNDGFVYGVSEGTTNIYVYDDYSDIMMTLPVTVSAEPVYSVTFDLNGQGGVYRTQEVGQGEKALRPGDPVCEGYIFGGWYTDAACEDKDFYSFDTPVTKDLLLYAKWTSIQPFNVHFKGIAADPYEGLWYNSQTKRYETVYTGYYIRPGVTVTGADGRILTEGTDYRVKYLNNRKASLEGNATVVIKGLGMYTGTLELPFHIEKADLNELKNRKLLNLSTAFAVKQGDKLNPVISYGTYVLKKSDYTLSLTGAPAQDTVTDISGTGRNFTGMIEAFPVKVLSKQEADRMSVKVTLVPVEHVYDGSRQLLSSSELSVTSAGTGESLRLNEDYSVTYYNNVEAGKARVVVTGINGYTGSVTKSFKIKSDRDSAVAVALADPDTPVYHTQGGAKPELSVTVTRSGEAYELRAGVDYKVTYSKNKKAGEGRYTVKFLNNYKGRTAVTGTYEIKARPLSMDGLTVFAGDLIYTIPAKYRVNPFVLYENARLAKKNYTLRYFDGERELAAGEKISLAEGENQKTITVLIEGKGNYTDSVRTTYNLVRSETAIDLSRAKIYAKDTMKRVGRQGYTGSPIEPQIDVYAKQNGELKLVDPDYYTVAYTDNINRGTATIVINGDISNAMGSRTGTFKIKRGILKELFSNL